MRGRWASPHGGVHMRPAWADALECGAGSTSPFLFRLTMFDRDDLQKFK
jgi:hypothetical protein